MALKLNGKDDQLTRQDFMMLARTIDLPAGHTNDILSDMTSRVLDSGGGDGLANI